MAYTPTSWTPGVFGTEITSARLNNIENGIDAAHAGIGVVHTGGTSKADVIATLDAAEAIGKGTVAMFPAATYDLGTGLSLNGYSCQIRGQGAAMLNSTTPAGTVFYASSQSGPVLDFKGWAAPAEFSGKVRHGDFSVLGSGVADATKANIGLRVDFCQSTTFADIAILGTGGPCMKFTADTPGYAVYLCDFERITMRTPVNAKTNDVPYFHAKEANCNRYRGFGFISRSSSADCGVSGAAIIEGTASYQSQSNLCDAWWFENLHAPTGGCLVSNAGNLNTFRDFQFVDTAQESGATGTCYYRLLPSTVNDFGGNSVVGEIWGDNGGGATSIVTGVEVQQANNRIEGIKGYRGNNVTIFSGVGRTVVHLKGSRSGASTIGWTDNSGAFSNHLIDEYMQVEKKPVGWATTGVGNYYILGSTGVDFAFDAVSGNRTAFQVTLTANITMTAINNPVQGTTYTVAVKQDATGSRTLTWPSSIRWAGNTAPTLTTTAGRTDLFTFFYDGATFREVSRSLNQN